jgi:hypothetical protein
METAVGYIFRKVSDASGGVLPGVTVTGTGFQQALVATISEDGTYQFPSVPIGTYTVTFALSTFKKASRRSGIITNGSLSDNPLRKIVNDSIKAAGQILKHNLLHDRERGRKPSRPCPISAHAIHHQKSFDARPPSA